MVGEYIDKKFKLTFKTQIYAVQDLIIISVIFLIGLWYVLSAIDTGKILLMFVFMGFYLASFLLPTAILHVNYLKKSQVKELCVREDGLEIDGIVVKTMYILKVDLFATQPHLDDKVGAASLPYFDYYYYLVVETSNHQKYIVTSLLGVNIDKAIEQLVGSKLFKHKTFFPSCP